MNLRISVQHALLVKKTGSIYEVLEGTVAGCSGGAFCGGVGQAVKAVMAVHRMVKGNERPLWRRGNVCSAISQYLSASWDETAALVDLDASFYRRLSWRIYTGEFPLSSGICGSRGIDLPLHGPRVLSGSSPHHREGFGGRPRDGKTAVCGAARGKETSVWICSIRTGGLRRSVARRGQCAAKKWRQRENRKPFPSGVNLLVYP
ncbi:hypothetical protein TcBrA4_0013700 [Trypanosoma cruzi]|nr:hypothetical protein TcBrA4_0013700 [Trypanosoma cruzi]